MLRSLVCVNLSEIGICQCLFAYMRSAISAFALSNTTRETSHGPSLNHLFSLFDQDLHLPLWVAEDHVRGVYSR